MWVDDGTKALMTPGQTGISLGEQTPSLPLRILSNHNIDSCILCIYEGGNIKESVQGDGIAMRAAAGAGDTGVKGRGCTPRGLRRFAE